MEPMTALEKELLDEMASRYGRKLTEGEDACVEGLVRDFVRFQDQAPPKQAMERIYISKEAAWVPSSGRSVKPGNLRLNLGKLLEALVSSAAVYFTALAQPVFAIFIGLVACRSLVKAATVDLSQDDALVIWAAWMCEQRAQAVTARNIQASANTEAARVGHPSRFTVEQILASLERLEKIGAVTRFNSEWQTTETVIVKT